MEEEILNNKLNSDFFKTLFLKNREALMTIEPPSVNFSHANPSAVEMFGGKNEEEFLSYKQSDLAPEIQPDGRASAEKGKAMIEKVMKDGFCLFEWLHKRINGEEFFADVFLSKIEQAGKVIIFISIRDITERKKLELEVVDKKREVENQKLAILNILEDVEKEKNNQEQLANELKKFQLAVDNAFDQVVITDIEGVVLYGNRAVKKITGYEPEEALGKKAGVLWKVPMPKEYYEKLWNTIKKEKKIFVSEIQNKRKNGEIYTADLSISPVLDNNNDIVYFVAIEHDISERKEAENQIRKVLNDMQEQAQGLMIAKSKDEAILTGIGDGVITTNQDGTITLINQSALSMFGYSKEEVLNMPVLDVVKLVNESEEIIPLSQRPMVRALSTGEKATVPTGVTYYYLRKDGSKFPVGITVTPFMLNTKIIGTIEVFRDITIEKDIDKAKTEFVSLASHQLRTPLSTVSWYSEMLLSGDVGELNDQQKNFVNEIYNGNKRMIELVSSLLNVSRIELGTFAVEPEISDIKEIVESVLGELKPIVIEKKMSIKTTYEDNLEKINLDKKLIRIVFQNLLTNALKYTDDGGKIDLSVKTKDDDYVLVTVSDNGFGVPQSQQGEIFKKLFRADNAKAKDKSGTGLGLYIIKSIIEQSSGGKLWFESIENKGTTFYFTLPKKGMVPKKGSHPLI
jgi:PAS domain S-box-containing protein